MPVYKANDSFQTSLRSTWTADPADTTMAVSSIPNNFPTIVTSNAGSTSEKKFSVTGYSGDSPSNYQLTGVTKISGPDENVSSGSILVCYNHEDFFNQYSEIVNEDYLRLVDQSEDPATPDSGKTIFFLKDGIAFTKDDEGTVTQITTNFEKEHNADGTHSNINAESAITIKQIATPANPASGYNKIYFKSDNKAYTLTSAGTEVALSTIPRTTTETSSATPTINTDNTDIHTITALDTAITSMTTNLSGTPVNGQKLIIRILDNGTARAITWGASFASRGATLPTTTVSSKYLYVGLIWNSTTSTWDAVAAVTEE